MCVFYSLEFLVHADQSTMETKRMFKAFQTWAFLIDRDYSKTWRRLLINHPAFQSKLGIPLFLLESHRHCVKNTRVRIKLIMKFKFSSTC